MTRWILAGLFLLAGCGGPRMIVEEGFAPIFDGRTLAGWEGSEEFFQVREDFIVGGRPDAPTPRNEFLCRREEVGDFDLRLSFYLQEGVNSGVQFRSQRIPGSHETIGYQADLGEGYWGALYDESRRNRVLAGPQAAVIEEVLDRDGWNRYRILAEGPRIQLWINGRQTVDYTEPDATVARSGRICLQIHSGPPGEARFMDVRMREM
jgi:hypothetical protein